jgi:hypothetical protein
MANEHGPDGRRKHRRGGLAPRIARGGPAAAGRSTMAEIARRIFSAFDGVSGELVPGPFEDSDMQLSLTTPNGLAVSVLPDVDVPALYELVRMDSFSLLGDKLSSGRVLELLRDAGVAKAQEPAHG